MRHPLERRRGAITVGAGGGVAGTVLFAAGMGLGVLLGSLLLPGHRPPERAAVPKVTLAVPAPKAPLAALPPGSGEPPKFDPAPSGPMPPPPDRLPELPTTLALLTGPARPPLEVARVLPPVRPTPVIPPPVAPVSLPGSLPTPVAVAVPPVAAVPLLEAASEAAAVATIGLGRVGQVASTWSGGFGALVPAALVPVPPPLPAALPAWRRHGVSVSVPPGRPCIALVIDDLGHDRHRTAAVARLPGPLTLAFLPYVGGLPGQTAAARDAGHELLVHLPMEPLDTTVDPGPDVLQVHLEADDNARRLARALAAFDDYVGVNNHMGSRFTADPTAVGPVLSDLHRRGLLFLDSVTSPGTVAGRLARRLGMPSAVRDVFLDSEPTAAGVRAALAQVEEIARRQGLAIAIGHPTDVTLSVLKPWLLSAAARGFALVPISTAAAGIVPPVPLLAGGP